MRTVFQSRWLWLALIFAAGAALRFFRIDAMSLWLDEALQYQIASAGSLLEVIRRALAEANPPLSHIINYLFLQFGQSDFFLRLPSVLFGVASLPIFYRVATEISPPRAALVSTAMFALSPFHLWYSQEARPYSQLVFFALLSTKFLYAALKCGGLARWVGYVLAVILGFATQVFMGFIFAAHLAWVATCHSNRLRQYMTAATGVLLSLAWFLPFYLKSFILSTGEYERTGVSAGELSYTFFTYSAGFSFGPSTADLHLDRTIGGLAEFAPSIFSVAMVFGVLSLMGIWSLKGEEWGQGKVLCICIICFALGGTALYALGLTYNVRYTIGAFPFYYILIGAGFNYLWNSKQFLAIVFSVSLVSIIGLSIHNYFLNDRYFKSDVRSAIAYWRKAPCRQPLLSCSKLVANRYIDSTDRKQFHDISSSSDRLGEINRYLQAGEHSLIQVLIPKRADWDGSFEKKIRKKWKVIDEKWFSGAVLISLRL